MGSDASENRQIGFCEEAYVYQEPESQLAAQEEADPDSAWAYLVKRGKKPISLNGIEWRILKLLASRPYHAFPSRHIAAAVTRESEPVTEESLRSHIASLRDKLGFFADYVQTVPYIGYRFRE